MYKICKEKNDFWNIVKGIGILSIVIGHTSLNLSKYVYLYHLTIFFFVSGYFYSETKYGNDPFHNMILRLKKNWKKYFLFSLFFILFHNLFLKYGIIINSINYNFLDIIIQIINSMIFQCGEVLSGALWFVPVMIFSSAIFGTIIYFSRKMENIFDRTWIKHFTILLSMILFCIIGVKLHQNNIHIFYHLQTSILVIPIFIVAYYIRKINDINKYLKWYIFIVCIIFLYSCVNYLFWNIELSINSIPDYMFYLISFVGIYACLYLSKIILKIKYINNYFILIGKYSFEIMALHFFIIKIIDLIYAQIIGENSVIVYGIFPCAYNELWIIYTIFATIIPCIIMIGGKKIIEKIKKISVFSNKAKLN